MPCSATPRTVIPHSMDKVAALSAILEQNPTDAFARYGLAMAYAAEGKDDRALTEYATILEHTPDYVPAYQMSAQLLLKAGRPQEAQTRLISGIEAAEKAGNAHAAAEMQALLEDLPT